MFRLIKSQNIKALRLLGRKFGNNKQTIPAILCLEIVFTNWPNMYQMSAADISELIGDFYLYCTLMENIAHSRNPCNDPLIQRLFNIVPSGDNRFLLRKGTFIWESALKFRTPAANDEQGIIVPEWDLSRNFAKFIFSRLADRIMAENASCRGAAAFTPCINYLVNDHCGRFQCPHQHIRSPSLTQEWRMLQIKIHFQQIVIFQMLPPHLCHPVERTSNLKYVSDVSHN